jgi:uncharacterized protein
LIARRGRVDPASLAGTSPPVIADPLFYLLAIVAVILLGLSKGGFIGIGLMALPLMSLMVPPLQAAAIILPTVLAQDALTVWTYRREWSSWNLKVMIPSMAAGVAVAGLVAAALTAAHIRLAIGLIAAVFVLRHWLGARFDRLAPRANLFTGVIWGAVGGFTTMLANAGGPAWQMHLLPQRLDKLTYVGTFTMLFAASNLEDPGLRGARAADRRESRNRRDPAPARGDRQLCRHLAGTAHADRAVLPHRLRSDVRDLARAHSQRPHGDGARLSDCGAAMQESAGAGDASPL